MKRFAIALVLGVSLLGLSACNPPAFLPNLQCQVDCKQIFHTGA